MYNYYNIAFRHAENSFMFRKKKTANLKLKLKFSFRDFCLENRKVKKIFKWFVAYTFYFAISHHQSTIRIQLFSDIDTG